MNRINFIPSRAILAQQRRLMAMRVAVVALTAIVAAGVWQAYAQLQITDLDQQITSLASQITSIKEATLDTSDQSTPTRSSRSQQQALYKKVKTPVPPSSVMAVVARLMPPTMGLTKFSFTGEPAKANPRKAVGQRASKGKSPQEKARPLRLVLEGLAPNDVAVGQLMARLDETPLFDNIELAYSRPIENGTKIMREFQVTADIPMDRHFSLVRKQKAPHENKS